MRVLLESSGEIIKEGMDVFSKLMQIQSLKVFLAFLQSLQESRIIHRTDTIIREIF